MAKKRVAYVNFDQPNAGEEVVAEARVGTGNSNQRGTERNLGCHWMIGENQVTPRAGNYAFDLVNLELPKTVFYNVKITIKKKKKRGKSSYKIQLDTGAELEGSNKVDCLTLVNLINLDSALYQPFDPFVVRVRPLCGGVEGCAEFVQYDVMVKTKGRRKTETTQLQKVFKARGHYFLPILLSNGSICYYAVEDKQKVINILTRMLDKKEEHAGLTEDSEYIPQIHIGVEAPIYYENFLGLYITKKIGIVKKRLQKKDDNWLYAPNQCP